MTWLLINRRILSRCLSRPTSDCSEGERGSRLLTSFAKRCSSYRISLSTGNGCMFTTMRTFGMVRAKKGSIVLAQVDRGIVLKTITPK